MYSLSLKCFNVHKVLLMSKNEIVNLCCMKEALMHNDFNAIIVNGTSIYASGPKLNSADRYIRVNCIASDMTY